MIKKHNKISMRAQVSLYFIGIMASLIITAFIVINIGKTSKDLTYAENAADASALAGACVMAQGFNDQSFQNGTDPKTNPNESENTKTDMVQNANQAVAYHNDGEGAGAEAKAAQPPPAPEEQMFAGHQANANGTVNTAAPIVFASLKQPVFVARRGQGNDQKRALNREAQQKRNRSAESGQRSELYGGDSGKEEPNYYDNALVMALKLNFQNSGTQHRLGKLNSKMYEMFLKSITPENVENGMPYTFAWVDGAARFHMVTAIVEIEPCNNFIDKNQQDNYSKQQGRATEETANNLKMRQTAIQGSIADANSRAWAWPLTLPSLAARAVGAQNNSISNNPFRLASAETRAAEGEGQNNTQSEPSPDTNSDSDKITEYHDDIVNSRTVWATNFQFHMGSPIKSLIDIDVMTFYPPVAGSAVASFNYTGRGNIHRRGGSGSDPRHECGLISAF